MIQMDELDMYSTNSFKFCFLSNSEKEAEESGIEGILNRLEKERNSSFGLGSKEKEDSISSGNNEDENNSHHRSIEYSVSKFNTGFLLCHHIHHIICINYLSIQELWNT